MRTVTTSLYTAQELKVRFPAGFSRAFALHLVRHETYEWDDELWESIMQMARVIGVDVCHRNCVIAYGAYHESVADAGYGNGGLEGMDLVDAVACCRDIAANADLWPSGYAFDATFARHIIQRHEEGASTGAEIFVGFADVARREIESDLEYIRSEEYFLDNDESEYLADGTAWAGH